MKIVVTIFFTYYLFHITERYKTESIMGSCLSGDHIAEDHTHRDITTFDIEEPQQKYRLGTGSNRLPGALKHVLGNMIFNMIW